MYADRTSLTEETGDILDMVVQVRRCFLRKCVNDAILIATQTCYEFDKSRVGAVGVDFLGHVGDI